MERREPVDLLVKASGLSRRQFAREHGVGEQVLLRLSQGRFSSVPQSIVDAVYAAHNIDELQDLLRDAYGSDEVQESYARWRESLPAVLLPTEQDIAAQDTALSPAQRLAAAVGSMSKLAKITKTHDFVVRRYVHGETRELPASMRAAMEEQKWPHTDQLDRAQQAWLSRQEAK
jgi:hypothetical protein